MHLLHTPSRSDTYYQPTSPKRDHTRTYQAKTKTCVHRAYPGSIKNAFQEYNRESSMFWVSRHEVSPPMMRMSGHGTHVAGQERDLTAQDCINKPVIDIIPSTCPCQRLQCSNNNNNNMCMQKNCPDHGIVGRKGGVIFCS